MEQKTKLPAKKARKTSQKKTKKVQPEPTVVRPDPIPSYSLRVLKSLVDSPVATSYSLRSASKLDYSSDEDTDSRATRKPIGRIGLSEAKFRKQIATQKHVASTPYAEDTTTTTRSNRRNFNNTLETTTTTITRKTTPQEAQEKGSDVEEEEEVVTIVRETKTTVEPAAWHDIGWKEVGLAGFIAGVGVLGYICYVSDVCGYC